ncbi:CBU_0592 family membrane protein [Haloglycomyces albus]|uniref:CBU_0592 family membrane protein n=1 Tax=Haloglycomyces albus TaxID=526067 RepID=UPI0004B132E2|nr:hypothetical protein [Haloglycomyces albus]
MFDFDVRIALQFLGAIIYIVQYILVQSHRLEATHPSSLLLLGSGAGILLVSSFMGYDWGLILLNGAWVVMVTTTYTVRRVRRVEEAALADAVLVEAETHTTPAQSASETYYIPARTETAQAVSVG